MEVYVVSALAIAIIPLTVGYFFGKNQVNPDSEFGRKYYNSDPWDWK